MNYSRFPTMQQQCTTSITSNTSHCTNVVAITSERVKKQAASSHVSKFEALASPSREDAIEQGRLILVAEDSKTNQLVIKRLLGLLGYAADFTENGHDALNCLSKTDYALLITDLYMPEMDGYELTTSLRAIEPEEGRHIPVIALTANSFDDEAERCRNVGIDDYLSKPARLEDLKTMLAKWVPAGLPKAHRPACQTMKSLCS